MSSRLLRLAAIATAAGAFSGLFGVGGGTIIVPLLVIWTAYVASIGGDWMPAHRYLVASFVVLVLLGAELFRAQIPLAENRPAEALALFRKFQKDHPRSARIAQVNELVEKLEERVPRP